MSARRSFSGISRLLVRFAAERDGTTAIEYGLIAALICLALIGSLAATGDSVSSMWQNVGDKVTAAFAKN